MKDEDIDYSDIPPLDESFFTKALVQIPTKKDSVTIRVDHNVLEWFRHKGKGYQTLINAILKAYVDTHQRPKIKTHKKAKSVHHLRSHKNQ